MAKILDPLKILTLRLLGTFRSGVIGRYGIAVLAQTENGLLLTPSTDLMVGRRLCFDGRYDPELLDLLLNKCRPVSDVLFVGAHVGALVVPVAKNVHRVVAVEANPATLDLLRMNVLLNGLQNVEIHGFAAGDKNCEVSFFAGRLNSGGSGIATDGPNDWAHEYDNPKQISVPMRRLDEVFSDDQFDLIVMDIEGAESLALRGMSNLLQRSRGLLVEVFESHLREVAKVSNEEFLSSIAPNFDQATILLEKPRKGRPVAIGPYLKPAFPTMMEQCCAHRMTNVLFWKQER